MGDYAKLANRPYAFMGEICVGCNKRFVRIAPHLLISNEIEHIRRNTLSRIAPYGLLSAGMQMRWTLAFCNRNFVVARIA